LNAHSPTAAAALDFDNDVLFGSDPEPGILAVGAGPAGSAEVFVKEGEDVGVRREPLRPVAWLGSAAPGTTPLEGDLPLSHLVTLPSWTEFPGLQKILKATGGPTFTWSDPAQHFLAVTGKTLFKGMDFGDLRRLQIDIETETSPGFDFSHPARDPVAAIALSDSSGWERLLLVEPGSPGSEKEVIAEAGRLILERDPDVIEGHNILKFDFPFLVARARKHRLVLGWGRGGAAVASRPSRLQIAERAIQFDRFEVRGRHVVDTWILAQHYDVATRELENFGLKAIAEHFGVSEPGRVHIAGGAISSAYRSGDPAFATYALQDVRETRAIAAILSRSFFIQTRMLPFNYQDTIMRGSATKIDALLLREYLRRRHAIPVPPPPEDFEGGQTEVFETGVLRDVWHCDASSLYPSVMLAFGIAPRNDRLGVFSSLLGSLRRFRLEAKLAAAQAPSPDERSRLDALQGAFKILINSFYGYLGFAQGHFADFAAARDVAARGRQILGGMVTWLREAGARVIEIDTDGIYFQPPGGVSPRDLSEGMAKDLPDGIEVGFGTCYRAMFSYKAKNYALLGEDGRVIIKGGALKSRGMEPYLRDFLGGMIRHLLEGEPGKAAALRDRMLADIRARKVPLDSLARTETLQESPSAYARKIASASRNRSAAFELALQSGRDYRAGDQIRYYISGDTPKVTAYLAARPVHAHNPAAPDENSAYYAAKLKDLAAKFEPVFPRADDLFSTLPPAP
jgi:DNA polymerase, archaea type